MKFKQLAVSISKENAGVWVDVGESARILVARVNNPVYKQRFTTLFAPHKNAVRNDMMSEKLAFDILTDVMATTILLGWDGFEREDGTPDLYSVERATELLGNPVMKDFRAMVQTYSEDAQLFRESVFEASADVLKPTSGG